MRNLLRHALFGALLSAFPALAHATPCGTATLATYSAPGFSCTLLNGTLSNFSLAASTASGGAIPLTADNIVIATQQANIDGLAFWVIQFETPSFAGLGTEDWVANAGQQLDFTVTYDLSYGPGVLPGVRIYSLEADGSEDLSGLEGLGSGFSVPAVTGDGLVTATETDADGAAGASFSDVLAQCGPLVSTCPGVSGYTASLQNVNFGPLSDFVISTEFDIDGGEAGSAELPGYQTLQFEQAAVVPEPSSLMFFGAGLAALGLFFGFRADKRRENSSGNPRYV